MDEQTDQLADVDDVAELLCPSCGADLVNDDVFFQERICAACGRHFSISATERVALLLDDGTFRPITGETSVFDSLNVDQVSSLDRVSLPNERRILDEAVVTGTGKIGGQATVLVVLDDQLVGANVGAVAGEKILLAMEAALVRKLPVVLVLAGRNANSQVGPLALIQGARFITVAAQLQMACLPMIVVLAHPTSAGMFSVIASQGDVIIAEPGATIGTSWIADVSPEVASRVVDARELVPAGMIDDVVSRSDQVSWISNALELLVGDKPQSKSPMEARGIEGIPFGSIVTQPIELHGDRTELDDPKVRTGFGWLKNQRIAWAIQDPAVVDGPGSVGAMRKIQRVARLAGRFELPLLLLVQASVETARAEMMPAESLACAKLGSMISMLPVPVISVGTGIIRGTLDNMMMAGDRRIMLEDARYQLVFGESDRPVRGRMGGTPLVINWEPKDCARFGLVDSVIETSDAVKARLVDELTAEMQTLRALGSRRLVESRHQRHRQLGQQTEAGLAAFRNELNEWADVQANVGRSIDEWREKIGARLEQSGRFQFQKPDLTEFAQKVRARRDDLLERSGRAFHDKGDGE